MTTMTDTPATKPAIAVTENAAVIAVGDNVIVTTTRRYGTVTSVSSSARATATANVDFGGETTVCYLADLLPAPAERIVDGVGRQKVNVLDADGCFVSQVTAYGTEHQVRAFAELQITPDDDPRHELLTAIAYGHIPATRAECENHAASCEICGAETDFNGLPDDEVFAFVLAAHQYAKTPIQ